MAPPSTVASYRYVLNYLCQWRVPTTPEITSAWARGYLDDKEWEYGVKINGDCVPWQKQVRELARTRISPRDAYRLWKLEKLDDEEFQRALIENGIDWERDRGYWGDAFQQYPPMGDLVRMMV